MLLTRANVLSKQETLGAFTSRSLRETVSAQGGEWAARNPQLLLARPLVFRNSQA